jgi:hypothetical protein
VGGCAWLHSRSSQSTAEQLGTSWWVGRQAEGMVDSSRLRCVCVEVGNRE